MLEYFLLILTCQLAGEAFVTATGIPFPGPVVGMLIMFVFLLVRRSVPSKLGQVTRALLDNLSLLFVPAGVGVILHLKLLSEDLLPLTAAMVVSTLLTIAVTGMIMNSLNRQTTDSTSNSRGN